MKPTTYSLKVPEEASGERLDKWLTSALSDLSRSQVKGLLDNGHVSPSLSPSHKVKAGQGFIITVPPAEPTYLIAESIPLIIAYEDEHLLVVDKQAGLTVHPGAGQKTGTLVHALLAHCGDSLSGIGGVERPGIVHRLDKDTSGLMVVAKNDIAHRNLSEQLKQRELSRIYMALVWGVAQPTAGVINQNLDRHPVDRKKRAVSTRGGKHAITNYKTLKTYGKKTASLIECKLDTGRTHQIRVHMAWLGHPLIGDKTYGKHRNMPVIKGMPPEQFEKIQRFPRQALHAWKLGFTHPVSGEKLQFESNLSSPTAEDITEIESYFADLRKL